jgi:hypothetical protein
MEVANSSQGYSLATALRPDRQFPVWRIRFGSSLDSFKCPVRFLCIAVSFGRNFTQLGAAASFVIAYPIHLRLMARLTVLPT